MDDTVSKHMIAEATLTAHFIAAALKAGMSKTEINAVLAKVAKESVISEFWISDAKGRIEFTNIPGANFKFPTDVNAKSQAAPFAALLSGAKKHRHPGLSAAQTGRQVTLQIRGRGGRGQTPHRTGRRGRGEIAASPLRRRKRV